MLLLLLGVLQRYWAMLSFRMLYLYLEGYRLVLGRTITMDTYVDRLLYLLYAFWETELNCLGSSVI